MPYIIVANAVVVIIIKTVIKIVISLFIFMIVLVTYIASRPIVELILREVTT